MRSISVLILVFCLVPNPAFCSISVHEYVSAVTLLAEEAPTPATQAKMRTLSEEFASGATENTFSELRQELEHRGFTPYQVDQMVNQGTQISQIMANKGLSENQKQMAFNQVIMQNPNVFLPVTGSMGSPCTNFQILEVAAILGSFYGSIYFFSKLITVDGQLGVLEVGGLSVLPGMLIAYLMQKTLDKKCPW